MCILAGICLAAAVLTLAPLRLSAVCENGGVTLTGRAGPVPVKLFPRRERRQERDTKSGGGKSAKKLADLPRPVVKILAECGCEAAGRLLARLRVERLRLRYTAGGPDPYRAVMAYARAGVAMEGIAAALACADLRADVDLTAERSALAGEIGLRLRLGTVLAAAFCFGIGFLRRYYQYKREKG